MTTTPTPPVPPVPNANELSRFRSHPPDFLSPIRRFTADEEAQEYIYDAWEEPSPEEKFRLCQRALQIFPFSVDAFNAMAAEYDRFWNDKEKALLAYQRALECAKILWPDIEKKEEILWGYTENRPLLRAYHGLALVNIDLGNTETAVRQLRFLLRVNPSDNQGCRLLLFLTLIDLGEYDEAKMVAEKHAEGRKSLDCIFAWGYLLIIYATKSHREHLIKRTLCRALQQNYHVADLLLKDEPPTESPQYVSHGSMDEAVSCVKRLFCPWKAIDGLSEWLQEMRSSGGSLKPQDDGTVLFHLLKKGKIPIVLQSKQQAEDGSERNVIEVTSNVYCMTGGALPEFKLPPGMKTHDPTKIVCFNYTNRFDRSRHEDFISFNYKDVIEVPFWRVLDEVEEWSTDNERKRDCAVCHKPASKSCSLCKVTWYCSRDCQKKDWKGGHKEKCNDFVKK